MSIEEGCRHFLAANCAHAVVDLLKGGPNVSDLPPTYCFIQGMNFESKGADCQLELQTTTPRADIGELNLEMWADFLRLQYHAKPQSIGLLFWCLLASAESDFKQSFLCILVKVKGYETVLYRFTEDLEFIDKPPIWEFLPMFEIDFEEELTLQ